MLWHWTYWSSCCFPDSAPIRLFWWLLMKLIPFPQFLGLVHVHGTDLFFGSIVLAYRQSPSSETEARLLWKDCLCLGKLCQQSSMLQNAPVLHSCSAAAALHLYLQGEAREERFWLAILDTLSTASRKLICQRDSQTEAFFTFLSVFTTWINSMVFYNTIEQIMRQLCMLARSRRAKKANSQVWHLYYLKEMC